MATEIIKNYYQDNSVADTYDRERFSSLSGRTFDWLEKRMLRKIVRRVVKEVSQPEVIDVPCGTGRITELLLKMGLKVTGADISREMIEVAQTKCQQYETRIHFRQLDLDAADLPENEYDLVTCIRMLHHLNSSTRKGIFKSLSRMSRKYVLVNVSFSSPFYRLRRQLKCWLGQGISRESSTWAQILEETSEAGLKVAGWSFIARYVSEDLILLLEKTK